MAPPRHPMSASVPVLGFWSAFVLALVLTGCASAPPQRQELPPFDTAGVSGRLSPEQANDITLYAIGLVGTPYRYGGNTPETGFDCSGLIGHVYATRAGAKPPRTVAALQNWGTQIAASDLRSGDLVVFAPGGVATHAGIYVGAGRFVHAPSTGGEVRLDALNSKYWTSLPVAFRRP
ncbi:MAG: C40 family peptidase [Comamonadaceae bacterium]|nr:C40 family peptidase [Comamonadaceae bacterium]